MNGDWQALVKFLKGDADDSSKSCEKTEKLLGEFSLDQLLEQLEDDWKVQKQIEIIDPDKALALKTNSRFLEKENYKLYQLDQIKGRRKVVKQVRFFETKDNYSFASGCKIKLKDKSKKLLKRYGKPSKILESTEGTLLSFVKEEDLTSKEGMVFLTKEGRVKSWIYFDSKTFD